jgi:predicted RNA polymerase sigma factor
LRSSHLFFSFQVDVKTMIPLKSEALYRLVSHFERSKQYDGALTYRVELRNLMKEAGLQRGYATAVADVADLHARLGHAEEAAQGYREAAELWKV